MSTDARPRVLVVDDNQVIRTVVVAMLTHMGAECDVAESGFEAVHAVRQKVYQLVLMDLKMPGLDGPSAARTILAHAGQRPRIVGVTSDLNDGAREACLSAGMVAVLKKPLRLADLAPWMPARAPA